ncbi:MAG: hypothetical protein Q8Q80_17235 [Methyloversatilis sp.]|uniref:hypothetical protein n=1 Tax=Methyloversatilis sp. TaxID=2569862 RepID=UPI002737052E|nr:hypothetical protein [Methyloversatilis sp.]MDP3874406.1 hypothetical protein [Methyloversatilis sp.]
MSRFIDARRRSLVPSGRSRRGSIGAPSRFSAAGICPFSVHSEKQFPKESSFLTVIDKEFVVLT